MLNGRSSSMPGRAELTVFLIICLGFAIYPALAGAYATSAVSYFIIMTFLGISLSVVWGYTGIFSFGQAALFGIGGYTYGIIAGNLGDPNLTFVALVGGLAAAALAAAVLGYFMFYGGVSDVYVGITTLAVTLVLSTFMYQTSGSQWVVGKVQLGGYNGMTNIPALQLTIGSFTLSFAGVALYYLALGVLVVTYAGLVILLRSRFGYAMIAIRENRERSELLGYNLRLIQLIVFVIGGVLAGLSGIFYATWGNYMTPSTMAMTSASLPVIWVAVGGRKSLVAVIIATIILLFVQQSLAGRGDQYALVIFGALLTAVMLFVPDGFIVIFARFVSRIAMRTSGRNKRLVSPPSTT